MKKRIIKILWICAMFCIFSLTLPHNIYATDEEIPVDWFNILPELTEEEISGLDDKINQIWKTWGWVRNEYNKVASGLSTSEQLASWIMNRDTIMNYLVFIVKFLSQLWLVVWAIFIMKAWYYYMFSVFKWSQVPSKSLTNAIIWVIIVIFSYAILRILTSIVGLS